jgi:hypothetical protein
MKTFFCALLCFAGVFSLSAQTTPPPAPQELSPSQFNLKPCCDLDDYRLELEFYGPLRALENCSVVTGTVTVEHPLQGTGTYTVCVEFTSSASTDGHFELNDRGDFTTVTTIGNVTELCRTVSYPVALNEEGEPLGYIILDFYVVPITSGGPTNAPLIRNTTATIVVDGVSCDCDSGQNYLYSPDDDVVFNINRTYNIPNGADLSDLFSSCNLFHCFQDPATYTGPGNAYIALNGELNVDVDYVIGDPRSTFFSSLTLGPNTKINVLPGVTLEIANTEVSGCREMWDAITVQDGGTLKINKSVITGGKKAITVEDGGKLIADRSEFLNNHVSIYTPPSPTQTYRPTQEPEVSVFGCTFDFVVRGVTGFYEPSPFLLAPYFGENPRAGGEFNDVKSGILFSNSRSFSNLGGSMNTFQNLNNGLIFNRSAATVEGTNFFNMRYVVGETSGNGVFNQGNGRHRYTSQSVNIWNRDDLSSKSVSFKRMKNAVHVDGANRTTVEGTTMEEVEVGIRATNPSRILFRENVVSSTRAGVLVNGRARVSGLDIRDNVFDAKALNNVSVAIEVNDPASPILSNITDRIQDNDIQMNGATYGILATNSLRPTIRNNTVSWTGPMYGSTAMQFAGGHVPSVSGNLIVGSTGGNFTETFGLTQLMVNRPSIFCNSISDIETGIFFIGNNQRARLRGNNIQNGGIGLQLGIPQVATPTLISPQVHNSNKWLGNFAGFAAAYFNASTQQQSQSKITVDGTFNSSFLPPTINIDANQWVRNQAGNPNDYYSCPAGLPPGGFVSAPVDKLTEDIVNGDYKPSANWQASKWLADLRLYRAQQEGEINTSLYPNWNTWVDATERKEVKNYHAVEVAIANITATTTAVKNSLETAGQQLDSLGMLYTNLTNDLYFDSLANTSALQAARLATISAMSAINFSVDSINQAANQNWTAKLAMARTMNDYLVTNEPYLLNQQQANKYYLELLEYGPAGLAPFEQSILTMANQCPFDGGEAVYQARAMAAFFGDSPVYDDVALCSTNKNLSAGKVTEAVKPQLSVYPNPVAGYLTILTENKAVEEISIFDALGRNVLSRNGHTFDPAVGITLYLPEHLSGMHTARVIYADGQIASKTIIIK